MKTETVRFCEFTGDSTHCWDEVGYKRACHYISITDKCLLHDKPLGLRDGWRTCCDACGVPVQVIDCFVGD